MPADPPLDPALAARHAADLRLLGRVSDRIDGEPDSGRAMQRALEQLALEEGLQRPMLWMRVPGGDVVQIEVSSGLSDSESRRGVYRLGEGITGRVVEEGAPSVVLDVASEPRFLGRAVHRRRLRARRTSYICVPLRAGGRTLGALSVDRVGGTNAEVAADARLLAVIGSLLSTCVRELARSMADRSGPTDTEGAAVVVRPPWMIGHSKPMEGVYRAIGQVAVASTTALILGESGTGKELVARALHESSPRAAEPFVKVNCGAIPEGVIESELFGHERGAFTGALQQRKGRFELAEGGTIFLDEVGELSSAAQVRLLRVLQEREFERVGGARTIAVDVRVVAATSRNLEQLIADERFRADLFYRLNVFPIHVPPLRERGSDVIELTDHFVAKFNTRHLRSVRRVATSALDALTAYHWPGNVRELENCIERAVLISTDDVIHAHNLPPSLQTDGTTGTGTRGDLQVQLDNLERALVLDALKSEGGNMTRAAERLNVSERVMGLRVRKHGIEPRRFRRR